MPPSLTFPGVYIEELPSGVHTITGVATSITAFIGWAPKGPIDEATFIGNWSDYVTQFGGFDSRSNLGYAVNQFFANGGQQAYIVRIVWDGSLAAAPGTTPVLSDTARAVGIGAAASTITATLNSVSSKATLVVGTPVLLNIALTPTVLPLLQPAQTQQLTATGSYSDTSTKNLTATATWKSASPTIATVSSGGLVTGLAVGSAIISATVGQVTTSVPVDVGSAVLIAISVTPATASISGAQTQQFQATGTYSDGTTQDLTSVVAWTSSNAADATVSPTGLATEIPVAAAAAITITAKLGAISGTATLTVNPSVLASIAVAPVHPLPIAPGATQSFSATGTFTDGTTAAPSSPAWSTSNPSVATVDGTGKATGVGPGSTLITVTSGGISGSVTLNVTTATLSSISVTPVAVSVAAGLTQQFSAKGIYSDGSSLDVTSGATWASATPATATIVATSGLATAVAPGTSVISATIGAVSGSGTLTVAAKVLQSIAVTPATASIPGGSTQQFTATGTYSDGTTGPVAGATWTSSNTTVATVSGTGLAKAIATGGSLTLFAANPGTWGNSIQVSVLASSSTPSSFGLQVQVGGKVVENFSNLSVVSTDPRYAVSVIDSGSNYITFVDPATNSPVVPASVPSQSATPIGFTGGQDGSPLVPASDGNFEIAMLSNAAGGINFLSRVDIFNLLVVPGETDGATISQLQAFCATERSFLIVDAPQTATVSNLFTSGPASTGSGSITTAPNAGNSAYYFPWISVPDPLFGNRPKLLPPSGTVAGIYAATDSGPGVWKAPAGINAGITGDQGLQYMLTDSENGQLNPQAINCLRHFKVYGDVVWGARTLLGNDQVGSQWKYIPIRRFALFLESSLYEGTQWMVFEPNDEKLWSQARLNIGAFMNEYFLKGAFQGTTPQQAYFVKCDSENNPQASIDLGIVSILVGFAPLYPAEFVVIQIQQMAGQIQT